MLSRWPVYERVLANLMDGSAIDGVLIRKSGPLIVLSDAVLYTHAGEPSKLDGEVYVERVNILYLQATAPRQNGFTNAADRQ